MITVSQRVLVSAPKASVAAYLRALENMPRYEHRLNSARVETTDEQGGVVEVSGRFLGMPWRGSLKMQFTEDGGYRCEMVRGPLKRMSAGFHLREVSGGTVVTREEHYQFPLLLRPLSPFLKKRIWRSIELELGVVKEGAEFLNRQLQIRQIDADL